MTQRAIWVAIYAIAMAVVESAVVVYLRALHPGSDQIAALRAVTATDRLVPIELAREAATMVMLLAVAGLSARDKWPRFLWFCYAFGVWDIAYYVWLRVFEGWPASLLDWDVLFLIPVIWVGPVLAPVLVSVGFIGGALWLLSKRSGDAEAAPPPPLYVWGVWLASAGIIYASFVMDSANVLASGYPASFRWGMFLAGLAVGVAGLFIAARRA